MNGFNDIIRINPEKRFGKLCVRDIAESSVIQLYKSIFEIIVSHVKNKKLFKFYIYEIFMIIRKASYYKFST